MQYSKENTFISCGFDEPILYAPARVNNLCPCSKLKIVTAFTDCDRISTHMIKLAEGMKNNSFVKGLKVEIILGMTKTNLSPKKHEDICRLIGFLNDSKDMPEISCRYICNGAEVHSKLYLWESKDEKSDKMIPYRAYCGSLNYTMNAFYKRREIVTLCDTMKAWQYYRDLLLDTIDCFDSGIAERLKNTVNNVAAEEEPDDSETEYQRYNRTTPVGTIKISLLKADGSDTGHGSGINWGIRPNGTPRDRDQAYIPYNSADRKEGFFPDRLSLADENCPMFKVITKDFGSFHMRMAQQGNKALHSVESNAILGKWIRKEIGVPPGTFITKQMLENYGKTYVVFRKYADGTYLLDF